MAKPFQDTLPFTEKAHISLGGLHSDTGAISKNDKRKGLGTYRSARLTSDLGKITQPVFLGCINKHVKNKNFKALISNPQICQGQMMFSKPGCLLQQVRFVDVMYLNIRTAFDSILCQLAAEELWTGRNYV